MRNIRIRKRLVEDWLIGGLVIPEMFRLIPSYPYGSPRDPGTSLSDRTGASDSSEDNLKILRLIRANNTKSVSHVIVTYVTLKLSAVIPSFRLLLQVSRHTLRRTLKPQISSGLFSSLPAASQSSCCMRPSSSPRRICDALWFVPNALDPSDDLDPER